jgi:hypothetical protein
MIRMAGASFCFLLLSALAYAQGDNSGSINGTVTDTSGAVLAGVKVTVTSPALIGQETQLTASQGLYRFPSLPIGIYKLTLETPGFATVIRENITVSTGFANAINVTMGIASQQQAVMVSSESPLVDTENSNIQNVINKQQLENLPNSRDIWSLMGVAPGMNIGTLDVGGSAAGTQPSYTAYGYSGQARTQIDGVNTTEGTSAAGYYWDYGSLAEFTVGTAANDASMPVPGVFVNGVVKSGSNKYHGSIYFDYENPNFQGHNISTTQLHEGAGIGTRTTRYYDPNGDFGGPIKHDRLWFYLSLRDQNLGHTVTGFPANNPGAGPNYDTYLQDITYKISSQLSKNHRLSHFIQWARKNQPYRNASNNYYQDAVYNQNSFTWAANIQYDGIITPKLFITARIATWGYNWMNTAYAGPDGVIDMRRQETQTGNLAGGYPPYRYDRRRWQYEPSGSYYLDGFLGANHQVKFGWISEKEKYQNEEYGPLGQVLQIYNSAVGAADFTTPYRATLYNEPSVSIDYQWHHGAYIQDQIRIKQRFTLNLGVRWDYYRVYENAEKVRSDVPNAGFFYAGLPLSNGYSIPASYPDYAIPAKPNLLRYPFGIVPRLGLAWDITGKGRTVLKVNWGRFLSNPAPDFGANVNSLQVTSYTFGWNDLNHDGKFQNNELGAFVSNSGGANVSVAPHIKQPTIDDSSIFIERQLTNDLSIRAGFVYRYVHHNWQQVDVSRTASLYTQPVQFFDPGPDGVKGTSDDRGNVTVYDIPSGVTVPASVFQYQTPNDNNSNYENFEISVNKRMSHKFMVAGSYYYTFNHYLLNGHPTNPDLAINNDVHTTNWTSHVSGTYEARWGIIVSPILRAQSGTPLNRILTVTGLRTGTFSDPVDPYGAYRSNNLYLFDTRVEKQLKFGERMRLGLFFDAFNIFNTNGNQTQDNTTGVKSVTVNGTPYSYQRFLAPTSVLAPRIFRLGLKFSF